MCTRSELIIKHNTIFGWLLRNKPQLLDKYFPKRTFSFEERLKHLYEWSEKFGTYPKRESENQDENCLAKFINRNSKKEEIKKYRTIYPKQNNTWNFNAVKEEALKYQTRGEFSIKSPTCYVWSLKNKCIEEVCSHMPKHMKQVRQFICNETGKIYNSRVIASQDLNLRSPRYISSVLSGKNKSTGGYTFKWLGENVDV